MIGTRAAAVNGRALYPPGPGPYDEAAPAAGDSPMPRDREVHVHLLPGLAPPGRLAGGVAVVIDVLRATTTIIHALAAGCQAVRPCAEVDEARELAGGMR